MIKRKEKICRSCGKPKILFSKGRCEECAKKEDYKPLKRSSIPPVSSKMRTQKFIYKRLRKVFMKEHPICEVCKRNKSEEVHHKRGRGIWYLVVSTWLAVCHLCHVRITRDSKWAIENGYSDSRTKND